MHSMSQFQFKATLSVSMTSKRILLIYLLTISTSVLAKRSFTLDISNLTCIGSGPMVTTFECHLESVNNRNVINGNLIFAKDITAAQIKVKADLTRPVGAPMTLLDVTVDGCQMLESTTSNTIVHAFLTGLTDASSFPKKCPVKANQRYTLHRFALDPDVFPLYTPEFNYTTNIRLIVGSKVICQILAMGSVESTKKSVVLRL